MNLDPHLAKIQDFPKPGITFYDISPVLEDPEILQKTVNTLAETAAEYQPDVIVGLDARGFYSASPWRCNSVWAPSWFERQANCPAT